MSLSKPMRHLLSKWQSKKGWPKHLASLEIKGIRGWDRLRIPFDFPMIAICGENGSGKSTILQAAAASYRPEESDKGKGCFASSFFPDTPWERIEDAEIRVTVKEGNDEHPTYIGKLSKRWRRNPLRRRRTVIYKDLSRVLPVPARAGYQRMTKPGVHETESTILDKEFTSRLSEIVGRSYQTAKLALTNVSNRRSVSVLTRAGDTFSGFHQGAGETMIGEILNMDPPRYSLLVIDEVETSLHPSAQRRLIRNLATLCKERELQIILSTHSPYVLSELPEEGRAYIFARACKREVVFGVSPEFAMTNMDDTVHPEFDLFVEDDRAEDLLREILANQMKNELLRFQFIRFGAASVGNSLGSMVKDNRFPRPSLVFLDGDQTVSDGCICLPGDDPPERVVFEGLKEKNWGKLHDRLDRGYADVADACTKAMTLEDHHEWVQNAASKLVKPGRVMWSLMCSEWVAHCLSNEVAKRIISAASDLLLPRASRVTSSAQTPPSGPTASALAPTPSKPANSLPSGPIGAPTSQRADSSAPPTQEAQGDLWLGLH